MRGLTVLHIKIHQSHINLKVYLQKNVGFGHRKISYLMILENIIFFAIDESAREIIYVSSIVHHDRANEVFINRRSLDI